MKIFHALTIILIAACVLIPLCFAATAAEGAKSSPDGKQFVYFGTYTGAQSKGIYVSRLDLSTGNLSAPVLAAEIASPSFLAIHPHHQFLYAVNEISNFSGDKSGAVSSFSIDATAGKLTLLNQKTSGGDGPCHLDLDKSGKFVLVANYGGGSIETLRIRDDGSLTDPSAFIQHKGSSVNPQRQEGPHAHYITTDPANRFALACDLGLDKVLVWQFGASDGILVPNDPPSASVKPGSGPRHLAFHPIGRFAYVINELFCTVTAFSYDEARGELKELQTISSLPADETVKPNYSTAEIEVHPSGNFLYGSNRGHNTIVVYAIAKKSGKLTLVEHQSTQGKTPRGFSIDPTGQYLLAGNQDSNTVVVFRINPKSGCLTPAGKSIEVGAPVCVKFMAVK